MGFKELWGSLPYWKRWFFTLIAFTIPLILISTYILSSNQGLFQVIIAGGLIAFGIPTTIFLSWIINSPNLRKSHVIVSIIYMGSLLFASPFVLRVISSIFYFPGFNLLANLENYPGLVSQLSSSIAILFLPVLIILLLTFIERKMSNHSKFTERWNNLKTFNKWFIPIFFASVFGFILLIPSPGLTIDKMIEGIFFIGIPWGIILGLSLNHYKSSFN